MTESHICHHRSQRPPSRETVRQLLHKAEERCLKNGWRWTESRAKVFEHLLKCGSPVKAYDLIPIVGSEKSPAKPPTVYRALEFLEEAGFVHRIATLNAFIACDLEQKPHVAAFLICECCGKADEFGQGITGATKKAAEEHGFEIHLATMELRGLCRACRKAPLGH